MALLVPKSYLSKREEIKNKDAFYQISVLLWFDSAPSDWLQRISDLGHPALISPRHDKDLLEDGSAKKTHWHILFLFKGRKSYDDCQYIADYISGQSDYEWLYVADRSVMARYLCHLDKYATVKHRYPISDLVSLNGAPISKLIERSEDETLEADEVLNDILEYIRTAHCVYFNKLVNYALENQYNNWIHRLRKDLTPFIKAYMAGYRLERMDLEAKIERDKRDSRLK